MDPANAFDVLILPILQCTAGIFATFPILHGMQVGLDQLFGTSRRSLSARDPR